MLSDQVLAAAGFDLYCVEFADVYEQRGGSFVGGVNIMECVYRLPDEKYVPIMRKYVGQIEKVWGKPASEVFALMGLEGESEQADALYYTLMACRGHGVGLKDHFRDAIDRYESVQGALDTSPIHTELTELNELAEENLPTPDDEWGLFDDGRLVIGKFHSKADAVKYRGDSNITEWKAKRVKIGDGNELLESVGSKYGAPMGRRDVTDNLQASVSVFRVRFVDGDYDMGGAYWGGGRDSKPLFCAHGDGFRAFRRAKGPEEFKKELKDEFPELTFA